jgi:hypothetical protein
VYFGCCSTSVRGKGIIITLVCIHLSGHLQCDVLDSLVQSRELLSHLELTSLKEHVGPGDAR